MTTCTRWLTAAAVSVSLSTLLLAQAPALDVRMGVWEITSTIDIGGQMPAMDTSGMTPAQKAQMEAAMKGMMGPHTTTDKSCITKEDFSKSALMLGQSDEDAEDCKQTIATNTRSTLEGTVVCTGENAMTRQIRIDAVSPTSIKAVMKGTHTEKGRTTTMNATMTGKWLGADCTGID